MTTGIGDNLIMWARNKLTKLMEVGFLILLYNIDFG